MARMFELHRDIDETGVSGTGVVAEGIEFTGGTVALRWLSDWPTSVVFHDKGIEAVKAVHGHGGKTRVVWLDDVETRGDWFPEVAAAVLDGVISILQSYRQDDGTYAVHPDSHDLLLEGLRCIINANLNATLPSQDVLSGQHDRLLIGFNMGAIFGPYLNTDGSVTLTSREVEKVTGLITTALQTAASAAFPYRVFHRGNPDDVVACFAQPYIAEAFCNLQRRDSDWNLVVSGPGYVAGRRVGSTASVATMPVPASREDQPKHDREQREAALDAVKAKDGSPADEDWVKEHAAWPSPDPATRQSTLDKLAAIRLRGTLTRQPLPAHQAALLETLYAKLRGMNWALTDRDYPPTDARHYVGTYRAQQAGVRAMQKHESYSGCSLVPIDDLIAELEKM